MGRRRTSGLLRGSVFFVLALALCASPTPSATAPSSPSAAFQPLPELRAQHADPGGKLLVDELPPEGVLEGGELLAAPPPMRPF